MDECFLPTGLLGPAPSISPSAFVSNGLLGSALHSEELNGLSSAPIPHSSDDTSQSKNEALLTGPLSSSQDDAFPLISDILGLRPNHSSQSLKSPIRPTPGMLARPHASFRATTFKGKLLFIPCKPRTVTLRKSSSTFPMVNLLDVPIHRLMDELSGSVSNNIIPDSKLEASHRPLDDVLWVDQYRPRRFTELLGNERVARDIMAWVKQWDWCVFGKRRNKKRPREDDQTYDLEDEYHRPREKLLLISGPPGLGKTTLAYVIAAQAGYEVVEINASDTRSAQSIDDRVRPLLESGSSIGSTKPVLLIIDEIDGATGGGSDNSSSFVQSLVSLTLDRPKKKRKAGVQKDKRPLLRPIICICNDHNAHSLAKLRPHARQVRYTRPADIHIVKRLREICELEGLVADTRALGTLVNAAKGDLRGCLNTLQFMKLRNGRVTEESIRRATAGMKEADVTATAVLNEIFAPLSRKRARELAMGEMEEARYVYRLSRAIEALNNLPNVANGCFAHYMNCHRHEANMSRYEKANEWLGTFDIFSSAMYADGDFGLQAYLPYLLVPLHPLCRERAGKRVERDSADWDNLLVTRTNEDILKSLSDGIFASGRNTGVNRHLVMGQVLHLEFVPYINRIISASLRPVNSQVIRPEERALLVRLVGIMVSLGLRFVQERTEDGQVAYRLDPPIDVFVTYDGRRAPDIAVSRYAVRHLIATEIDAAMVTRQAVAAEKVNVGPRNSTQKGVAARIFDDVECTTGDAEEEGPLEQTRPSGSDFGPVNKRARTQEFPDIADKPPVDFFGRPITTPKIVPSSSFKTKHQMTQAFQTTYRHLEGNSAAVRKAVKVASFV